MLNRRWILCCVVALCGLGIASTHVWSQDDEPVAKPKKKKKADADTGGMPGMPDPAQMAEMMKKCKMAGQPGPNHKFLADMAGEWTAKTKMWMDPSMPPTETSGKSVAKLVLDGRFLMDEYEGEMVMPNEKMEMTHIPFKGMGMTGYDNVKNLFVGSWVDSMSTGILTMSGSYNPMTKTLLMFGQMDDVMMNVHGKTLRYDTKIIDSDKHIFSMYDCHAGIDYKMMEITYTRVK